MTPYSEIYDLYSGMVTDYEFLNLNTVDQDEILFGWLLSSIGEFEGCKTNLADRDNTLKQFNQNLSDKEKKILAKLMVVEWLSPKLYNLENLRNQLTSKDFSTFSPANLLEKIQDTHEKAQKQVKKMIISYGYSNFKLEDLL